VRFGQLIAEQRWVKELDINLLLATPEQLVALDARVAVYSAEVGEDTLPKLAIRPYPTQYLPPWTLQDGMLVTIRSNRPEDEPLMVPFHTTFLERSV
jgi:acetyltransferase